ncbi:hypothetical protein [Phascolarctobacterium sp.]|uniref:hypothetical protein n=1 Tax=Phascolarctobacterium sp. TaxID=2049039 RepID=UPI00386BDCF0
MSAIQEIDLFATFAPTEAQQELLQRLREEPTEENLWQCIIAFQNTVFFTSRGLPFSYSLKRGRRGEFRGEYTKELFIDRRENSKSLAWSSVRMAWRKAMEQQGTVFARPKEIADIRGISYSYSLLWRFGLIQVPEAVAAKLQGGL